MKILRKTEVENTFQSVSMVNNEEFFNFHVAVRIFQEFLYFVAVRWITIDNFTYFYLQ